MYRGSAQSAAYLVGRENSPGTWRFEALQERGEILLAKLTAYLGLLGGESELAQVVRSVGASEKYGVTEGQLAHAHAWKDRKKVTEAGR
jgi:putative protease